MAKKKINELTVKDFPCCITEESLKNTLLKSDYVKLLNFMEDKEIIECSGQSLFLVDEVKKFLKINRE